MTFHYLNEKKFRYYCHYLKIGALQFRPMQDERPLVDCMLSGHLVRWSETNPEHLQMLLTLIDDVYSNSVNQVAGGALMEFADFHHWGGLTTRVPLYYPASWNYFQVLIGELRHLLTCAEGQRPEEVDYPLKSTDVLHQYLNHLLSI